MFKSRGLDYRAVEQFSVGPMITLQGHINAKDYVNILADQVHPMVQTLFPNVDGVLVDNNVSVPTAKIVQAWLFEYGYALSHLH